MLPFIASAAIVIIDQLVKHYVSANIAVGEVRPFIKDVLSLTHVHNNGAAFNILQGHMWLLSLTSSIAILLIIFLLLKKYIRHPLGVWSLAAVLGGAVGNLIDRLLHGYVVDMFKTVFIDFAIFNVADIFVTCGGIAFCIYLLFFYNKEHKNTSPESPAKAGDPEDGNE